MNGKKKQIKYGRIQIKEDDMIGFFLVFFTFFLSLAISGFFASSYLEEFIITAVLFFILFPLLLFLTETIAERFK